MPDSPLGECWQRAAAAELTSLLSELCLDRFTTAEDFCCQMLLASQLLRANHGQSERDRIIEWRRRLAEWERSGFNKIEGADEETGI